MNTNEEIKYEIKSCEMMNYDDAYDKSAQGFRNITSLLK